MRGTRGGAPPAPDARHRGGGGGVAHSTGTGRRRIGGIMRKRPGVQRRGNPPMCRRGRSAHGSPSAKNRHSSRSPGIMRKTPNRSAGEPLSNVQHRRADREEPKPGRPARPRCQTPPHGPGRAPRRRPRSCQMKQHPRNRSEKTPARPAAALRQTPPGVRSRPNPAGDRTHRTGPGLWAAAPGEKGSAPSDASGNVRADHCDRPRSPAFPPPRITLFLLFPNNLTGAWFSLTPSPVHGGHHEQVSMHLQVRGAP